MLWCFANARRRGMRYAGKVEGPARKARPAIIVLMALALLVSLMIAGCGPSARTTTSSTEAAGTTTISGATTAAPTASEASTDIGASSSTLPPSTSTVSGTGPTVATTSALPSNLPNLAPLNQAFLDSLHLPATDASSMAALGYPLGLRPSPQDFSSVRGIQIPSLGGLQLPSLGLEHAGAIPASYDLRVRGKVTSVKDQDPYGTCWAFAALGSLESCLLPGESWDFSEDNMVLTSGFDNRGKGAYNGGGDIPMSTAYLVRWGGPVAESADKYGDDYTPAGLSPRKHVQEINWIPARAGPLDNDNLKRAVIRYGGVAVSIDWEGPASDSPFYNASTTSYYCLGGVSGNHQVLVVGWDDDYPAANFAVPPLGNGAFLVKNSWGTGFGDGGYFYVSYYDSAFGCLSIMGAYDGGESTANYSGIYQYDPLGDVNSTGYSSPVGWFANVFTAQATSSLSAVGFYTLAPSSDYEVYSGASLMAMTRMTSGTFAYMGYHTVKLPQPLAATRGQPFVVAVKVTSPGIDNPIAIEYPLSDYSSAATAEPGQSYVSADGTSWVDLTQIQDNGNVCLKAYVTGDH
jgi:C1A family cysteine protease